MRDRPSAAFNGCVRTDVVPADVPIWCNDNAHQEFVYCMEDRAEVERWRQMLTLCLGEVIGEPTPGWLNLHLTQPDPPPPIRERSST